MPINAKRHPPPQIAMRLIGNAQSMPKTSLHHNPQPKFLGVILAGPLLEAIQSGSGDTEGLRRMLIKRARKTTLICVPDHQGLAGNEEADASAKQASAITDGAPRPADFAVCKENAPLRVPSARSQQQ